MGEQDQHMNGKAPSCVYKACVPQLVVEAPRALDAISFYKRAFGAVEVAKRLHKRKAEQELALILHAHLKFGEAEIMVCDEVEESGPNVKSPSTLKGTVAILHVVTDDVDAAFAKAVEAGAEQMEPVQDQQWGMRYGKVMDPFGFAWSFGTPLKDLQSAEAPDVAQQ